MIDTPLDRRRSLALRPGNSLCFGTKASAKDVLMLQMIHENIMAEDSVLVLDGVGHDYSKILAQARSVTPFVTLHKAGAQWISSVLEHSSQFVNIIDCGVSDSTAQEFQLAQVLKDLQMTMHNLYACGLKFEPKLHLYSYGLSASAIRTLAEMYIYSIPTRVSFHSFFDEPKNLRANATASEVQRIFTFSDSTVFFQTPLKALEHGDFPVALQTESMSRT